MKRIYKSFSLILSALIAITIIPLGTFTVSAVSGSGKCGANLTWSYSDGTLTISGGGDMYDYFPDNYQSDDERWQSGIYVYRNFNKVIIEEGVTSIGRGAFYNCKYLQSIKLPSSLKRIGDIAFDGCNKLNKVDISNIETWVKIQFGNIYNSNPLYYAKNLYINNVLATDIEIPYGVSKINDYAFYNCESIKNITI